MLTLQRRPGEEIVIEDARTGEIILAVRMADRQGRLGFRAFRPGLKIHRKEHLPPNSVPTREYGPAEEESAA